MMDNIVSIIVPVYNVAKYLPECLDSITGQTYQNLQIILVDDGSTDESGRICDEHAAHDARVVVIHQANAGAANAKNAGLDAATGQFIAFADSDDCVEPNWIEKMLSALLDSDSDVVECSFRIEYTTGSTPGNDSLVFVNKQFETEDYLRQYPTIWSCALFWNKLFRASLLQNVRFHTERRCIDDEFFTYKAVTGAKSVLRITDELYHYRQRRSSVTQSDKTIFQRTVDNIDILAERHQWIKNHYPALTKYYLRHDVDTLLYFAGSYPFNLQAIERFRKTAKYFFRECLRCFPGRVTMYYSAKMLFYKKFHLDVTTKTTETDLEKYFV